MTVKTRHFLSAVAMLLGIVASLASLNTYLRDYLDGLALELVTVSGLIVMLVVAWFERGWLLTQSDRIQKARPVIILTVLLASLIALAVSLATVRTLNELTSRMSLVNITRYVGTFPANLPDLITLIRSANKSVRIATDHAAYGAFSEPELHKLLISELVSQALDGREVELLYYGNTPLVSATKAQFENEFTTSQQVDDLLSSEKIERFLEYNKSYRPPTTLDDFLDIIVKKNEEVIAVLENAGVRTFPLPSEIPVLLWIIDGDEAAAYSFYNVGRDSSEVTFITVDRNVVPLLASIFDKHLIDSRLAGLAGFGDSHRIKPPNKESLSQEAQRRDQPATPALP